MGSSIRWVFCGVALLASALGCLTLASDPQQPFAITISTAQDVFKSGSEIRLQIILTNTSDHNILLGRAIDGTAPIVAGVLADVHVYGEKGNSPTETKYQRVLRGEEPPDDYLTNGVGTSLPPGKKSKEAVIVNKFYDLSKLGKYKIQLQWTDPTSKTVVKSNRITVAVTP